MDQVLALRPFLMSKDIEISRRFYEALGFKVTLQDGEIVILKWGSFSFILNRYYVKEVAERIAVQMLVRDVDAWWREVDPARLEAEFEIRPPKPPAMQPWGMKVGFITDPSGVLWHIAEVPF